MVSDDIGGAIIGGIFKFIAYVIMHLIIEMIFGAIFSHPRTALIIFAVFFFGFLFLSTFNN